MSNAKKILAQKGEEMARAGRLFFDAISGDGADRRTKVTREATRERGAAAPSVVVDAELVDDDDDDAPTVRTPKL